MFSLNNLMITHHIYKSDDINTIPASTQVLYINISNISSVSSVGNTINSNILLPPLQCLYCSGNKLTTFLLQLPTSLRILHCNSNKLTSLPRLSHLSSLQILYCSFNKLKSLPQLPKSLSELYCNHNRLVILPQLPTSLDELYCHNNKLTSLPQLPISLLILDCHNNRLTSLPPIPTSLQELIYHGNNMPQYNGMNLEQIIQYQAQIIEANTIKICNIVLVLAATLPHNMIKRVCRAMAIMQI